MNHLVPIRQKLWKDEEVKALIQSYKIHIDDFSNYNLKVVDVWQTISEELAKEGVKKSGFECDKKFRNLKTAFKKIYCDMDRTEESKYQWEFYEDLLEVMLTDKQLRRAAPIVKIDQVKQYSDGKNDQEEPQYTHIYTVETSGSENLQDISYTSETINSSEPIYIEIEEPPAKRRLLECNEEEEQQEEVNDLFEVEEDHDRPSDDVEKADDDNSLKHDDSQVIDESEPPLWFQNSFLMKYETNVKLMQDKLNKIFECQELQMTMLKNISNRLAKVERRLTPNSQ